MQLYAGLDLHSTNTYIGILDQEFNRVFRKRVANKLDIVTFMVFKICRLILIIGVF
jgi:hypothetical protein